MGLSGSRATPTKKSHPCPGPNGIRQRQPLRLMSGLREFSTTEGENMSQSCDELGQIADRLLELERNDELFNCTAHLVLAARRALRELSDRDRGPCISCLLDGQHCECVACALELWLRAFATPDQS